MEMDLQNPYAQAHQRGFPVHIAYLRFVPQPGPWLEDLVDLVPHLLGGPGQLTGILLSAFTQRDLIFEHLEASAIMSARSAEAYAFIRCDTIGGSKSDLRLACQTGAADEARIVTEFSNEAVVLFHDGHRGLEVLGDSERVLQCATQLLERKWRAGK